MLQYSCGSRARHRSQSDVWPGLSMRAVGQPAVRLVLAVAVAVIGLPALAQRPGIGGRRNRGTPAPRAPAQGRTVAPQGSKAGAAAAPAGGQKKGPATENAGKGRTPPAGTKPQDDAERPQTTATEGTEKRGTANQAEPLQRKAADIDQLAIATAWGAQIPFGAEWYQSHPYAWRVGGSEGEVVLASGAIGGATASDAAVTLATWTEPSDANPIATADQRPTVQVGGFQAGEDDSSELVVFPGIGAGPLPRSTGNPPATPAVDGTVSVLVRGENQSSTASVADETPPALPPAWLPLGTFAALPAGLGSDVVPHIFLQLSLHHDGTVRGNYFDAVSDTVQPLSGKLDRERGVVGWRIGGGGADFETTIEGLTAGRIEANVRKGAVSRGWTLISLQ
ncbi:MAG: hypothetical protein DWH79_06970 [Planctomycetota bacterium]|nr:MAG: hypothetical protein DWH79_06970 [Planctomycetota bacterium]